MKRSIALGLALTLALVLALSLAACGGGSKPAADGKANDTSAAISPTGSDGGEDKTDSDQGDPGDTEVPNWWGTFVGDEYTIGITNFDGQSFSFTILLTANGSIFADGVAALYPDNPLMAEYGQMSFSLYEDFNAVDVFAPESHENAHMRGHYVRE